MSFQTNPRGVEAADFVLEWSVGSGFRRTLVGLKLLSPLTHLTLALTFQTNPRGVEARIRASPPSAPS